MFREDTVAAAMPPRKETCSYTPWDSGGLGARNVPELK
jgi:hypothetical protein